MLVEPDEAVNLGLAFQGVRGQRFSFFYGQTAVNQFPAAITELASKHLCVKYNHF